MNRIRNIFKGEPIYHWLIWILLVGPHSFFSAYLIEDHLDLLFYCIAVADGLLIVIIYFITYYLIERYYERRQYWQFTAWLVVLFTIYVLACLKMELDISEALDRKRGALSFIVYYFINISRYTVIGFLFYSLNEKFNQKKKLDQVTVEKLQTEISYLRAQINPHFLFNTLNNLYGLSLERSEKTPEVIIKLSKMMDYMLYEVEGTKVLLQRDLENLENYIDMERIRQGNNAVIKYVQKGELTNQLVEPLLMLPLVENAFKHGVNEIIDGAYVEIFVVITRAHLVFQVKNNFAKRQNGKPQIHASLGLSNLKQRLQLFYPGKHELKITVNENQYDVVLDLDLS